MLILTRKRGEIIRIGDNIEVVVKEIDHNRVKLGIVAPPGVQVDREEIWEAKRKHEGHVRFSAFDKVDDWTASIPLGEDGKPSKTALAAEVERVTSYAANHVFFSDGGMIHCSCYEIGRWRVIEDAQAK